MGKYDNLPLAWKGVLKVPYTGQLLLEIPFYNKGTAFTHEERGEFDLHGLLPTNIQALEEQVDRAYQQYTSFGDDLQKNTFMTSMAAQNTVLYHRLLQDHLAEMFSVIYTPTEGEAIENYSRVFRKPEGCHLSIKHPDDVENRMRRFIKQGEPNNGVDYIVVSDGEAILGIGDQGIGGILISVAKSVLMTACAGVHPYRTLPVVLDVGTKNKKLLDDPLYLGHKINRVRGEEYDTLVENFVSTSRKLFPNAYIHFEDFGLTNARRLLDRYRDKIPCFNDDIQGTGCVTLAAIIAGLKVNKTELKDIKLLVFGAGSAGCGIAEQVQTAIAAASGKSKEDAAAQIW